MGKHVRVCGGYMDTGSAWRIDHAVKQMNIGYWSVLATVWVLPERTRSSSNLSALVNVDSQ